MALGAPPVARAAGGSAVLTILEGSATLIRGTSKLGAAGCVRAQPDDLIETGKDTYAQLEFEDGTRLDLGPKTQLQIEHPGETRADRPALYLLSGWIKLTVGGQHSPGPAFATPVFDGVDLVGAVLARIDARGGTLFVEQGRARLANRHTHGGTLALKDGDFVSVSREGRATVDTRPSKEFVDQMPRPFRDSIPSRLAVCHEREVAAKPLGEISYREVEPWINAELSVRRQFVHAWRSKADDPDFRLELTARLSLHPEWGPVLFPELYAPKPKPEPAPEPVAAPAPETAPAVASPTPVAAPAPPTTIGVPAPPQAPSGAAATPDAGVAAPAAPPPQPGAPTK
jgi:hypothetical protein